MTVAPDQVLACTGSAHALAGVGQKKRTVGSALDQASGAVKKLVRNPFKRNASMRTAIDEYLSVRALPYQEQRFASVHDAAATGVGDIIEAAERDRLVFERGWHGRIIVPYRVLCQSVQRFGRACRATGGGWHEAF